MKLLTDAKDSLKITYLADLEERESVRQKTIQMARDYHESDQGVEVPKRLRLFIKSFANGHPFNMNVCRSVITAMTERLSILGFDSKDPETITWAEKIWLLNDLAAVQDDLYEFALRDGEAFIIVGWDKNEERVRLSLHQRFVDVDAGGDGYGCRVKFENDDPNQSMLYGEKFWAEDIDGYLTRRKNVFYPNEIKKYKMDNHGDWVQYQEEGETQWPLPWVLATGKPMGIPVIPFLNKGMRCEAWDAIPMQDAINKEVIDLLMAGDQTAFRIFKAIGFIPTSDGKPPKEDRSNWQIVEPGEVVATTASTQDASFDAIDGADLGPLMDLVQQFVMWAAMVTETPITRFITTKLIASDETLKEQENPLLSRVRVRQILFGSAWTRCLTLARRLEDSLGSAVTFASDFDIKLLWREAQIRGETEKLTNLKAKQDIGIPEQQLWKEAGYSQAQIQQMQAQKVVPPTEPNVDKTKDDNNDGKDGRDVPKE